ncbi:hypothetical protein BDV28DRAFT_8529 [Aspergillus coremiiformis]|uniref:Mid2 domain-containing protein n=1 Tax=Aspergillus coremiiformis TaxID=138285 RepID=A0A5N6Z3Q1_9EURO|nr:hypothetical protein BDV28DRAFT_8529 [Aspergillus coremiiformis]
MNLILLIALASASTAANTKCYFLDGSVASADVPCTTDSTTNCCNKKDVCMSNGLCYIQGSRGMALSRGSCTDKSWGPRCFAPCSSTNRNNGYPIVNVGYSGGTSTYCCGAVAFKDGKITCQAEGDPFRIDFGTAIPGVAGLARNMSCSTTTSSSNSTESGSTGNSTESGSTGNATCENTGPADRNGSTRDVAIGAGVGVPLGVVALLSMGWALYERRQRQVAERVGMAVPGKEEGEDGPLRGMGDGHAVPAELVDSGRPVLSELDAGPVKVEAR